MHAEDRRWVAQLNGVESMIFRQAWGTITHMRRSSRSWVADFQFFISKPRNLTRLEIIAKVKQMRKVTDEEFTNWQARYDRAYGCLIAS